MSVGKPERRRRADEGLHVGTRNDRPLERIVGDDEALVAGSQCVGTEIESGHQPEQVFAAVPGRNMPSRRRRSASAPAPAIGSDLHEHIAAADQVRTV